MSLRAVESSFFGSIPPYMNLVLLPSIALCILDLQATFKGCRGQKLGLLAPWILGSSEPGFGAVGTEQLPLGRVSKQT